MRRHFAKTGPSRWWGMYGSLPRSCQSRQYEKTMDLSSRALVQGAFQKTGPPFQEDPRDRGELSNGRSIRQSEGRPSIRSVVRRASVSSRDSCDTGAVRKTISELSPSSCMRYLSPLHTDSISLKSGHEKICCRIFFRSKSIWLIVVCPTAGLIVPVSGKATMLRISSITFDPAVSVFF